MTNVKLTNGSVVSQSVLVYILSKLNLLFNNDNNANKDMDELKLLASNPNHVLSPACILYLKQIHLVENNYLMSDSVRNVILSCN